MAGKWSIATKEPAGAPAASIGESDGKATFPANTSTTTDNVYTITYTDDNGCVSTTDYTVKKSEPAQKCSVKVRFNNTYMENITITLSDYLTGEEYYRFTIDESFTDSVVYNLNDGESRTMKMYASTDCGWGLDWQNDEVHCGDELYITGEKTVTVWGRYKTQPEALGYFDVVDSNDNAFNMPFNLHIKYYVYVSPESNCGCGAGAHGGCLDGPYYVTIEQGESSENEPYVCTNSSTGHVSYNSIDCSGGASPDHPTGISTNGATYDAYSISKNGLTVYLKTECPF